MQTNVLQDVMGEAFDVLDREKRGEVPVDTWPLTFHHPDWLPTLMCEALGLLEREKKPAVPVLRQGTGALRAMLTTKAHVTKARRKNNTWLAPKETEARCLFKYEPLGWAERLVLHGLATLARDERLLDAHPSALVSRHIAHHSQSKVVLPFPGVTALARVIGFPLTSRGKLAESDRKLILRALKSLATIPRWIAMPVTVMMKPEGESKARWVEDIEVTQTLWVEAAKLVFNQSTTLKLHPAILTSQLKSFFTVPNLAARYDGALRAIGARQMRDDFAILDDYLRLRAAGCAAAAARRPDDPPDLSSTAADDTLIELLALESYVKKWGRKAALRRIEEAMDFCKAMGSLLRSSKAGSVWTFTFPIPEGVAHDAG